MEPVSSKNFFYAEEEIDIRGIINTLLRHKWLILSISLFMAIAGFAFSKLVLPKQYQPTAIIILSEPIYSTNFDPRIQTAPQMPDPKSLSDLVKADDLLGEIFESPEAAELLQADESLKDLKERLVVTLVGLNQLSLKVTDTDPERAARLANFWAEKVNRRLNELFDVNDRSLSQIEEQRNQAHQNWTTAQEALLDYMPENRVNTLETGLGQARSNLQQVLAKIDGIDILISDIKLLDARFAGRNQNASLLLEDALSLITLQQRSIGGENLVQVQVNGSNILGVEYTVAEARNSLQLLSDVLTRQRQELEAELNELETTITTLATDLEDAKYRLNDLTMQRDLALSAYQALSSQEDETRIALAQNDQVSKLASRAMPPEEDIGPHSVLNGLIAGVLGLIVTIVAIFSLEWWRSSSPAEQKLDVEKGKSS